MCRLLWTKIFILSVIAISTEWAMAQAVKIMPLGDSITLGDKSTSTNGYRLTVANLFSSAGLPFDLVGSLKNGTIPDNDHEGHGGWTSGQILDAVNGFLANANPNVVFLHIGTNDLANTTPDQVATNIEALLTGSMASTLKSRFTWRS
jgi:lysophospholipase L1-like esterase